MNKIIYLLFAVLPLFGLVACEDNLDSIESTEFSADWVNRNQTFFFERMDEAKQAVKEAQATYGEQWEEHCDWRIFRSYMKPEGGNVMDSICVKIIERGEGQTVPLYSDQAKLNYMGHLIPTENHPNGFVFDHSSLYADEDYVFDPNFAAPVTMVVGNTIEGFSTAIQHMHTGDRWMVYIPSLLGYGAVAQNAIPQFSTLVFDVQLVSFQRIEMAP